MSRTLSAFVLAVPLSLFACSGDALDADRTADGDEALTAAKYTETISFRSEADIQAKIDLFRARNGSAWQMPLSLNEDGDRLNGVLLSMRREDAYGPDVSLTKTAAIDLARTFLQDNADLFGITAADVLAASFDAEPITASDYTWSVNARGERRQAGYEAFESVATKINATVSIGRDGTVRYVGRGGPVYPALTLTAKPRYGAKDPHVLKHVVGRDLVWTGGVHTYVNPPPPVRDHVGVITPNDVTSSELYIDVASSYSAEATTFHLVWFLEVTKGGHSWFFFVDTATGKLSSWGQSDY